MSDQSSRTVALGARDVVLLTAEAFCIWLLAKLTLPPDVDDAVIPTLTLLAVRRFRHAGKRESASRSIQP